MIKVELPLEISHELEDKIKFAVLKEREQVKESCPFGWTLAFTEPMPQITYLWLKKEKTVDIWLRGSAEGPAIEIKIRDEREEAEVAGQLERLGLLEVKKGAEDPEEVKRVWVR